MEGKQTRRMYDQEFKKEAVRLVIEGNGTACKIASELGINENILFSVNNCLQNILYL
ncbi:MAG: transposase [Ignavibacteriaceae bacterium]